MKPIQHSLAVSLIVFVACGNAARSETDVQLPDLPSPMGDAGTALPPEPPVSEPPEGMPPTQRPPEPTPSFEVFVENPQLDIINDIYSRGPTDVWFASGDDPSEWAVHRGQILHYDGSTTLEGLDTNSRVLAIHGTPSGAVWAVGASGFAANYDGESSFSILSRPTNGDIYDTWGNDEHRLLGGQTLGALRRATPPMFDEYSWEEIDGSSRSDVHCVGGTDAGFWTCTEETCWGNDGEWHNLVGGPSSRCDIAPFADRGALILIDNAVFAVAFDRLLLTDSFFGPTSLPVPAAVTRRETSLRGLYVGGSTAWVVGTNGYVARNDTFYTDVFGGTWTRVSVPTEADLYSVAGDTGAIWVGGDGIILRLEQ